MTLKVPPGKGSGQTAEGKEQSSDGDLMGQRELPPCRRGKRALVHAQGVATKEMRVVKLGSELAVVVLPGVSPGTPLESSQRWSSGVAVSVWMVVLVRVIVHHKNQA